jgi:TonB family protein
VKPHLLAFALIAAIPSCQAAPETRPTDPLKVYHADVRARVGAVWNRLAPLVARRVSVGTVKVRFEIAPDGRVHNLKIASNTGNAALADLAIRTVQGTRIPPIPPTLVAGLPNGRMPADYDFTFSPPQ